MTNLPKILVLGVSLLAVAGCGRKPAYHSASQPAQSAPAQGAQAARQQEPEATTAGCSSQVPDSIAIQRAIQKAMVSIYGVDEAPAKFRVVQIVPIDCEHVTVRYRPASAGMAVQSSPMALGDGGKWYLTLYNKQYPVD
jgi:hypothetical protein